MADFSEDLKKLPAQPGVYIMHDEQDAIIYVGKAVNLHNRVRSYFRKIVGRGPQIDRMVKQISRFEYIVTDSELEALILENNLIKEHRPKYNTMLKDDKTYPYIKVTVGEAYPRVLFSRQMKKDKSRYFGPFSSAQAVRQTIELINRMYGLRDCNRVLPRDFGKDRPCLNFHMDRCCGPCAGNVPEEDYRGRIDLALEFLSGNYKPVIRDLTEKMEKASDGLRFEEAVRWRDLLQSVQQVAQKQKMSEGIGENRDILGIAVEKENADTDGVVQVFFIRDGKLMGREHHYMTHVGGQSEGAILSEFIQQFYAATPFVPREIFLPVEPEDHALLEEWLGARRGSKVTIFVPKKGKKEKLVELAGENAALILQKDRERLRREEGRTIGAAKEIAELLGISSARRMEAYDISDISGFANVGSMVVYENGKPKRSDYRKFRIQSVAGPNDYACMHEVLTRRFRHGMEEQRELEEKNLDRELGSFTRFPDLILMDGGRGQVNIAEQVLGELGLDIPVCGMVKDDSHRTRGLYFHNVEMPIDTGGEGFKLITRIQDEAHRFAIEYHRSLRGKAQVTSRLDAIPGIGPARKKALMRHFKSIGEIMAATREELEAVPGIPPSQAKAIRSFFHPEEEPEEKPED
ncbi:MAG: excinuclease ABC subunit UvrC, partial [Eubacteriales bacterium]|nr:excinuclease ABC subunit UvrC [Eubacteriales bacterium]